MTTMEVTEVQMMTTTLVDVGPLRAQLEGDVFAPDDADWDEARLAWNLAVDQHPAAVAHPGAGRGRRRPSSRSPARRACGSRPGHRAQRRRLRTARRHVLLIKTERMRGVDVDPAQRVARVGAGVTWGEVVGPAAEHGLAALAGSSPRRRRGRLHARRRRQLARPQARPGGEQRHGDRDRHRRRRAAPRDRRRGRRPVLGAARRRRELRRRHRDGVLPAADHGGLRGHAVLPDRARRRGPRGVAALERHGRRTR